MQLYETVIVYQPEIEESNLKDEVKKVVETIKEHGGSIKFEEFWGKKELAYEIDKKKEGNYYMLVHDGDTKLVTAIERQLRIDDNVLRSIVVKKDKFAPDRTERIREEFKKEFEKPQFDKMGFDAKPF